MNKITCHRLKNILAGKLKEVLDDVKETYGDGNHEEEAKVLFNQLAYYMTTVKSQAQVTDSEVDAACELGDVCCCALRLEELCADSGFLTALYHVVRLLAQKERVCDAVMLMKHTSLAAENYKQNDSVVNNIYFNMHLLFLDLAKSLELVYIENRTEENSKMWLDTLENALLILAYVNGTYLAQLFAQLCKYCSVSEDTIERMKSIKIRVFRALGEHARSDVEISNFKAVYQQFCYMVATLLSSYLVRNKVEVAVEILAAAFDSVQGFVDKQSIFMQCLMAFREIVLLFISKDVQSMTSRLKSCNSSVECLIDGSGEAKEAVGVMFTSVSKVVLDVRVHVWDRMSAGEWNGALDVPTQTQLHYLLLIMSEELGAKTGDHTGLRLSVSLDSTVVHCIYKSACHNTDGFETLVPQAVSVLTKCVNSLLEMKTGDSLMEARTGDSFWMTVWRAIAVGSYKLASICMKLNMHSLVKDLVIPLYQGMVLLEDSYVEPICFKDSFYMVLDMLVRSYLEQKRFRGALLACAVGIVSMPELGSRMFTLWAGVKKKSLEEENIQAITVQEVLTTRKSKISALNPNFNFQGLNYCELTVMELEAYHNSNVYLAKSIEAAYSTVPPSQCVHHCRALYVKLNCMWQSPESELCDEAIALCQDAICNLKKAKKNCPESERQLRLFLIAQMHFCLFLHNFKKTHRKQKEEVEVMQVFPTKTPWETGSVTDPNDVCDEIPAYASLTILKERAVLQHVDEAVSFWTEALAHETAPHRHVNVAAQLGDLKAAAFIYDMYGFQAQGLHVWSLYYKLGFRTGDRCACLTALCHLMEVVVCKNQHPKIQEMEEIIGELATDSSSCSTKSILFVYYLSRSTYCYVNKNYEGGVKFLKIMPELSRYVDTPLYVRYKVLAAKYLLLWPEVVTPDELGESQVSLVIRAAFDYIHSYATTYSSEKGDVCTYYQMLYVLFETSLFRGRQFLQLCWPREARSCLKDHLILVQKLSFATRTVQYLSLLAQVDVLCGAMNDAEVKITGMKYILSLDAMSFQEMFSPSKDKLEGTDSLAAQFASLKLSLGDEEEIWRDSGYTDDLEGSPILRKAPFSLPKFVSHRDDCHCVWCTNLAAQHLSLIVTMLEAVLHYHHHDKKTAQGFFKGGLRLAELLTMKLAKFLEQSCKQLLFPEQVCDLLSLNTCDSFNITKIKLMLNFSDILCSQCFFHMAQSVNKRAFVLLECVEDQNLWWEARKQQMDLALLAEGDALKQTLLMEGETVDKSGENESSPIPCSFKTPVCKAKLSCRPRRFCVARKMPGNEARVGSARKIVNFSETSTPQNQKSGSSITEELEDDVFTGGSASAASAASYSRSLRGCKDLERGKAVQIKSALKPSRRVVMSPSSGSSEDGKSSKRSEGTRSCRKKLPVVKVNNRPLAGNKENKVNVYVDTSDDSPEKCYATPKHDRASDRTRTAKTEGAATRRKKVLALSENAAGVSEVAETAVPSATRIKCRQTRKKGLRKCPFILQ